MLQRLFASRNRPYIRNLDNFEHLKFDLSGSTLEIGLPPNDSEVPNRDYGTRFNIFDEDKYQYTPRFSRSEYESELGYLPIHYRNWDMYGNIINSSHIGSVSCSIGLLSANNASKNINCYIHNHFEKLIDYDLYFSFGPGGGDDQYTLPINWYINRLNFKPSVYLEVWGKPWSTERTPRHLSRFNSKFYLPVSDKHVLTISFRVLGSLPEKPSNQCTKSFIDKIIANIQFSLSRDATKAKSGIENSNKNIVLSENHSINEWNFPQFRNGDITEGEANYVMTTPGTPPPSLLF